MSLRLEIFFLLNFHANIEPASLRISQIPDNRTNQEAVVQIKPQILFPLVLLIGASILTGCEQGPQSCPRYTHVKPENPESLAENSGLPFQFPLEDPGSYTQPIMTNFAVCGQDTPTRRECHAAEDYLGDPGTPVYAMADGELSFSGPAGGYGWLIIIDHPQVNLYSLYGHLSPSRWQAEPGPVEKGELIGYLGDPDENGGSPEHPLIPHLHFGIRAGQRTDYPGTGEWRWMAGWITICPQDSGWLQPSAVIASQTIPEGGFQMPSGSFLAIWWFPLLFGGIYLFGWICLLIYTTRRNKPQFLISFGVLYAAAGWIFFTKHARLSYVLFALAGLSIVLGIYRVARRASQKAQTES
jgi:murein DD-endopeptidase MepM/ murein hydrolase activator NlpD